MQDAISGWSVGALIKRRLRLETGGGDTRCIEFPSPHIFRIPPIKFPGLLGAFRDQCVACSVLLRAERLSRRRIRRDRDGRAAEKRNKLAPLHSIIASARAGLSCHPRAEGRVHAPDGTISASGEGKNKAFAREPVLQCRGDRRNPGSYRSNDGRRGRAHARDNDTGGRR